MLDLKEKLPEENTLLIGFNPGFGSGYGKLLTSWARDLVMLLGLNYRLVFTQASDFSDLRGETEVWQKLFDNNANLIAKAQENPFRAATHYTEDESKKTDSGIWSCANTHFYAYQGWSSRQPDERMTVSQVEQWLEGPKGRRLINDCLKWAN